MEDAGRAPGGGWHWREVHEHRGWSTEALGLAAVLSIEGVANPEDMSQWHHLPQFRNLIVMGLYSPTGRGRGAVPRGWRTAWHYLSNSFSRLAGS